MNPESTVLGVQFALWLEKRILHPEDMIPEIREKMNGLFDEPPLVLPVPDTVELDYQQVLRQGSSRGFSLAISRRRADLWINSQTGQSFEDMEADLVARCKAYFALFPTYTIGRVGFVVRFFHPFQQPPIALEKLLLKKPAELQDGQTYEVAVRYVTRHRIGLRDFNDATEISQYVNDTKTVGAVGTGVQVMRDFNSLPDDHSAFSWDEVETLIRESGNRFYLDRIEAQMWKDR